MLILRFIRFFTFVILVVSVGLTVQAQDVQPSHRLNDGWEFVRGDLGGAWEAFRPVAEGSPESLPIWKKVALPHCYNETDAVHPDVHYYQGPAWYRRLLSIQNPYANGRTILHFEGVGQVSRVYVGLHLVAEHRGGYDEWKVDITDAVLHYLKDPLQEPLRKQFKDRIPIAVRTDNSRNLELIPSDMSDFNLYGGLYRYVNLLYVPAQYVEQVFLEPSVRLGRDRKPASGVVKISGAFKLPGNHLFSDQKIFSGNAAPKGRMEFQEMDFNWRLISPAGQLLASGTKRINFDLTPRQEQLVGQNLLDSIVVSKPILWSTRNPQLYTLEMSWKQGALVQNWKEKFGFRTFEFVQKGPFLLNGERLLLRGTHRHEDHAGVAAALTEDQMREELLLMKKMGVNFIRLGHYQQSRIILNLCDSLGMVVWEEIPWCRGGLGGEVYQQQGKAMLQNMILQHYNHPSVVLWGLGNENDWPGDFPSFDKEAIRKYMKELNDLAHQLDPTRKTSIRRCDFCKDIVDVYSPSIWAGWYRGRYTEYKAVSEKEFNGVNHFLHVEWGGDSHAGRHSENPDQAMVGIKAAGAADERTGDASLYGGSARISKDGDWSESYICNLFDWHLKEQETMPWLTGTAQWVFKDFSTPIRPENPVPYMNQKGVVERDLTPKEAFYVFQSYWADQPMVRIYGHTMPIRWGRPGEKKMIKVYSNMKTAELFLNGRSLGVKTRNSQDFPAAGLRWEVDLTDGKHTAIVVAKNGKTEVRDTLNFEYTTTSWGKPTQIKLTRVPDQDKNGHIAVMAEFLDEKGNRCLDASNYFRFEWAGDGKMVVDQGTSSGSRLVQAYNGRALIRVEIKEGQQGMLSASSPALKTAFIPITQ
jgi:beta-galactosidase